MLEQAMGMAQQLPSERHLAGLSGRPRRCKPGMLDTKVQRDEERTGVSKVSLGTHCGLLFATIKWTHQEVGAQFMSSKGHPNIGSLLAHLSTYLNTVWPLDRNLRCELFRCSEKNTS